MSLLFPRKSWAFQEGGGISDVPEPDPNSPALSFEHTDGTQTFMFESKTKRAQFLKAFVKRRSAVVESKMGALL